LYGTLIGIEEAKNDMVVFICMEDNCDVSFVIVKQQYAKLPWYWKLNYSTYCQSMEKMEVGKEVWTVPDDRNYYILSCGQ
jgi:hypothetical protein